MTQIFQGVNKLFVLSFNANDSRIGNSRYYLPTAKAEDCNVVTNRRNFFDQPVKNYINTYENIWKITTGQGDGYTTGYFLDYNHIIKKDLSKQQALDADRKAI